MSKFGPLARLTFSELLKEVGEDPEPYPPLARNDVLECRARDMERAKALYESLSPRGDVLFAHAIEFVNCFGEFQRAALFRPFKAAWEDRCLDDPSMGALTRSLLQSGCTTSLLLDKCSIDEVASVLEALPYSATHTESERLRLEELSTPVIAYRGGWAVSAEELTSRGLSWTLCPAVADEFVVHNLGHREQEQSPLLLRSIVPRDAILAMFKHGNEVFVRPRHLRETLSITSPNVELYAGMRM